MATPATRTPIRIARGTHANLSASIADILDGEICWATDEDKIYVKDGGSLVATMLTSADIGTNVQAYDPTILTSADIGVSVQAYDANMLSSADIGVTVEGHDATILKSADIGVTVQAHDATTLKSADIGTTVQGYDADTAKLDVAQTFTAQQTFGEVKEGVYTLATTGSIALDPANGAIQISVLTGAPTFTDSLESGQTLVLHLEGGDANTVTWPTITWATSAGNAAPTLTAKDTLVFWKFSTTLYGAYVGSYV